jgi:hypothetical protein
MGWSDSSYGDQVGWYRKAVSAPVGPTKVHRGFRSAFTNVGVTTYTVDIGTAAADRLVVIGAICGTGATFGTVTVNGAALTKDAERNPSPGGAACAAVFSGVVASGSGSQTISIDFGLSSYEVKSIEVWTVTGLISTTKKQGVGAASGATFGGQVLAVDAGDLVFCAQYTGAPDDFNPSTQAPDATYDNNADNLIAGDWTISATNASFLIQHTGTFSSGAAASYR